MIAPGIVDHAPKLVRAGRRAWRTDRSSRTLFAPRRGAVRWLILPYVIVRRDDGSLAAINRDYSGLFIRLPCGAVSIASGKETFQRSGATWVYNDAARERAKFAAGVELLREWGMAEPLAAPR